MATLKRYAVRDMGASGYAVFDRERKRIVSWHKRLPDAKGKAERLNRG